MSQNVTESLILYSRGWWHRLFPAAAYHATSYLGHDNRWLIITEILGLINTYGGDGFFCGGRGRIRSGHFFNGRSSSISSIRLAHVPEISLHKIFLAQSENLENLKQIDSFWPMTLKSVITFQSVCVCVSNFFSNLLSLVFSIII